MKTFRYFRHALALLLVSVLPVSYTHLDVYKRQGMTTWELDKLIYDFIVKHGGTPNFKGLYGFPGTARCV